MMTIIVMWIVKTKMVLNKYTSRGRLHIRVRYENTHHLKEILGELKEEYPTISESVIPTKEFMEVLAFVDDYHEEIEPTEEIVEEDEIDIDDLF